MKQLLLIGGLFCASFSFSQVDFSRDVFSSSGSRLTNAWLQVNFTIGETFTSTFDPGVTHTLGFQQGDLSLANIHENDGGTFSLFPNPADEQINFTSSNNSSFIYHIYDVTGRVIRDGRSSNGELILDVTELVEGKYFLEYIPDSGQAQYLQFITIH